MPVMFSAMSYGSISYNAHKSQADANLQWNKYHGGARGKWHRILQGSYGYTGAAPTRIRDHVGIPIELALAAVDQRLRDEGISSSFSVKPIPRSIRRFPRKASMELIPMPPINSFISCFHAVIRLTRRLLPIAGSSLFTSSGRWELLRSEVYCRRHVTQESYHRRNPGERVHSGAGKISDNALVIVMKSKDDDHAPCLIFSKEASCSHYTG